MQQEYVYTRDGSKWRVIHRDEEKVVAAIQIVHQALTYSGDDYDEYEDDGQISVLSPSQCFDAPPTARVSQELKELERRANILRCEISDLAVELRAAQKAHDEKMAALAGRHKALERVEAYIDGAITHYVIKYQYSAPSLVSVEGDLDDFYDGGHHKKAGRLLTLRPEKIWSGQLVWQLNQYRDGSGSNETVIPVESYEEGLTHLQAWVNEQAEKGVFTLHVIDFAQKHDLALPDGYAAAVVEYEKAALLKDEQEAQEKRVEARRKAEARWAELAG